MDKLTIFWNALQVGQTLSDPKKWKNNQDMVNVMTGVIYGLLWLAQKYYPGLTVSGVEITEVAQYVAVVFSVILNIYLTTATTTSKGFGEKPVVVEIKNDDVVEK